MVDEWLGYTPSGEGEHDFLCVRKRGRNTHEVARLLARHAGVSQVAIGYAGLKDRNALTTQYFTVQLPGRASPDWGAMEEEGVEVVEVARHHRKIRRGSLRGNRFSIRVRDVTGDRDAAEWFLDRLSETGVPNYFGSQRFGNDGRNLAQVDALFAGTGRRPRRELRGLLLSAARAHLFNLVLGARVTADNWRVALPGEILMLAGAQRQFRNDPADATIGSRLATGDIHPTGPLVGRQGHALQPDMDALMLERQVLAPWVDWCTGLERFGLDVDRRALRLMPQELHWCWDGDDLVIGFTLPAGTYATTVLREVVAQSAD